MKDRRVPGSEGSFDAFVLEVRGSLLRQAYVLTGDQEEAQDLAQETLVRAWRHWAKISRYDRPQAWARRVLHNLAISHWRRERRAVRGRIAQFTPGDTVSDSCVDDLRMAAALRLLPNQQRRALVLHDALDVPVSVVAVELGVPEGTVKSWLSRGRKALARELTVHQSDEEPDSRQFRS